MNPSVIKIRAKVFLVQRIPSVPKCTGVLIVHRAEKSTEAFGEQKLVIFPVLSFLMQIVYIRPNVRQYKLNVFNDGTSLYYATSTKGKILTNQGIYTEHLGTS